MPFKPRATRRRSTKFPVRLLRASLNAPPRAHEDERVSLTVAREVASANIRLVNWLESLGLRDFPDFGQFITGKDAVENSNQKVRVIGFRQKTGSAHGCAFLLEQGVRRAGDKESRNASRPGIFMEKARDIQATERPLQRDIEGDRIDATLPRRLKCAR